MGHINLNIFYYNFATRQGLLWSGEVTHTYLVHTYNSFQSNLYNPIISDQFPTNPLLLFKALQWIFLYIFLNSLQSYNHDQNLFFSCRKWHMQIFTHLSNFERTFEDMNYDWKALHLLHFISNISNNLDKSPNWQRYGCKFGWL